MTTFPRPGGRWAVSTGGGAEAVWARDGRTLYYRTESGGVVRATYETGTGFTVRRTEVFQDASETSLDGADWDVDPSGTSFVTLGSRDSRGEVLHVALNLLTPR